MNLHNISEPEIVNACILYKLKLPIHELKNWDSRLTAYVAMGFTTHAFDDENVNIRMEAYQSLGFTKKALTDNSWRIRLHAYRELGFTEKAFKDMHWRVQFEAYETLGYTEESLYSNCPVIAARARAVLNRTIENSRFIERKRIVDALQIYKLENL